MSAKRNARDSCEYASLRLSFWNSVSSSFGSMSFSSSKLRRSNALASWFTMYVCRSSCSCTGPHTRNGCTLSHEPRPFETQVYIKCISCCAKRGTYSNIARNQIHHQEQAHYQHAAKALRCRLRYQHGTAHARLHSHHSSVISVSFLQELYELSPLVTHVLFVNVLIVYTWRARRE